MGQDPPWLSLPAAVCLGCYKILVTMLFLAPAGACTGLFLFLLFPSSAQDWLTPVSLPNDGEAIEGSGVLKLRSGRKPVLVLHDSSCHKQAGNWAKAAPKLGAYCCFCSH